MSDPNENYENNINFLHGFADGYHKGLAEGCGGGPPGGDDPNRRYNDGLGVGISSTFTTMMLLLAIIYIIYYLYLNPNARAALWGRLMNPFGRGGGPPGGGGGAASTGSPGDGARVANNESVGGKRRTHRKRRNLRKSHRRRQRGGGGNVEADVETIFKIANEILKEYNNSSNIIDLGAISKITKKIVDSKYKSVIDEINAGY